MQKINGLYGKKHFLVDIRCDVNNAGRTDDKQTWGERSFQPADGQTNPRGF